MYIIWVSSFLRSHHGKLSSWTWRNETEGNSVYSWNVSRKLEELSRLDNNKKKDQRSKKAWTENLNANRADGGMENRWVHAGRDTGNGANQEDVRQVWGGAKEHTHERNTGQTLGKNMYNKTKWQENNKSNAHGNNIQKANKYLKVKSSFLSCL